MLLYGFWRRDEFVTYVVACVCPQYHVQYANPGTNTKRQLSFSLIPNRALMSFHGNKIQYKCQPFLKDFFLYFKDVAILCNSCLSIFHTDMDI